VNVGALPQIERGQVKPEHLDSPAQSAQPAAGQRSRPVGGQRIVHGFEVGAKLCGRCIGRCLTRLRRLAGARLGKPKRRRGEAGLNPRKGSPVRPIRPVRRQIREAVGKMT
jgi:hypothetical protein